MKDINEILGMASRVQEQLEKAQADLDHVMVEGVSGGGLEQFSSIAAEIARLERRVCDRRPLGATLDHREQQVGVCIALRCVQHVMHALHGGCDAHGADMRRAFIGPDGELHGYTLNRERRTRGRANSSARSPACS